MHILKKSKILFSITALTLTTFCLNSNIDSFATSSVGVWQELNNNMPLPRGHLTSQIYKDKIYLFGGMDDNDTTTNRVDIYNIKNNSWETGANMPTSRFTMTSELYKNKIYVIGGATDYDIGTPKVEIYNIDTNTWTAGSDMLPGYDYNYMSSVVYNGKIYCIATEVIQVYDIENDSWEIVSIVPTARTAMESELYNGKIYTIGGFARGNRVNTVEVYDIKNDTWETKTPMPTAKDVFASEIYNGKIYTIGGYNGGSLDKVEVYDIASDSWSTRTSMPGGRSELETARLGNKIYAIGGMDTSWLKSGKVEVLTLEELNAEEQAIEAVEKAESTLLDEDINFARDIVDTLSEGPLKTSLSDRLSNLGFNDTLKPETVTANLDVYIKSKNMLSMSLETNSITFDGYSGTEDMEMLGAVNIIVDSSLPYQLNAYMPSEIANSDKSKTMPIDILNIKESSEVDYQTFANTNDRIILKDGCVKGNDLSHTIDLKLSSNQAYKTDIYKTVIKFEAEQK